MENEKEENGQRRTLVVRLDVQELQRLQHIKTYVLGLLREPLDPSDDLVEITIELSDEAYDDLLAVQAYLQDLVGHEVSLAEVTRVCLRAAPMTPHLLPILTTILQEDLPDSAS